MRKQYFTTFGSITMLGSVFLFLVMHNRIGRGGEGVSFLEVFRFLWDGDYGFGNGPVKRSGSVEEF